MDKTSIQPKQSLSDKFMNIFCKKIVNHRLTPSGSNDDHGDFSAKNDDDGDDGDLDHCQFLP